MFLPIVITFTLLAIIVCAHMVMFVFSKIVARLVTHLAMRISNAKIKFGKIYIWPFYGRLQINDMVIKTKYFTLYIDEFELAFFWWRNFSDSHSIGNKNCGNILVNGACFYLYNTGSSTVYEEVFDILGNELINHPTVVEITNNYANLLRQIQKMSFTVQNSQFSIANPQYSEYKLCLEVESCNANYFLNENFIADCDKTSTCINGNGGSSAIINHSLIAQYTRLCILFRRNTTISRVSTEKPYYLATKDSFEIVNSNNGNIDIKSDGITLKNGVASNELTLKLSATSSTTINYSQYIHSKLNELKDYLQDDHANRSQRPTFSRMIIYVSIESFAFCVYNRKDYMKFEANNCNFTLKNDYDLSEEENRMKVEFKASDNITLKLLDNYLMVFRFHKFAAEIERKCGIAEHSSNDYSILLAAERGIFYYSSDTIALLQRNISSFTEYSAPDVFQFYPLNVEISIDSTDVPFFCFANDQNVFDSDNLTNNEFLCISPQQFHSVFKYSSPDFDSKLANSEFKFNSQSNTIMSYVPHNISSHAYVLKMLAINESSPLKTNGNFKRYIEIGYVDTIEVSAKITSKADVYRLANCICQSSITLDVKFINANINCNGLTLRLLYNFLFNTIMNSYPLQSMLDIQEALNHMNIDCTKEKNANSLQFHNDFKINLAIQGLNMTSYLSNSVNLKASTNMVDVQYLSKNLQSTIKCQTSPIVSAIIENNKDVIGHLNSCGINMQLNSQTFTKHLDLSFLGTPKSTHIDIRIPQIFGSIDIKCLPALVRFFQQSYYFFINANNAYIHPQDIDKRCIHNIQSSCCIESEKFGASGFCINPSDFKINRLRIALPDISFQLSERDSFILSSHLREFNLERRNDYIENEQEFLMMTVRFESIFSGLYKIIDSEQFMKTSEISLQKFYSSSKSILPSKRLKFHNQSTGDLYTIGNIDCPQDQGDPCCGSLSLKTLPSSANNVQNIIITKKNKNIQNPEIALEFNSDYISSFSSESANAAGDDFSGSAISQATGDPTANNQETNFIDLDNNFSSLFDSSSFLASYRPFLCTYQAKYIYFEEFQTAIKAWLDIPEEFDWIFSNFCIINDENAKRSAGKIDEEKNQNSFDHNYSIDSIALYATPLFKDLPAKLLHLILKDVVNQVTYEYIFNLLMTFSSVNTSDITLALKKTGIHIRDFHVDLFQNTLLNKRVPAKDLINIEKLFVSTLIRFEGKIQSKFKKKQRMIKDLSLKMYRLSDTLHSSNHPRGSHNGFFSKNFDHHTKTIFFNFSLPMLNFWFDKIHSNFILDLNKLIFHFPCESKCLGNTPQGQKLNFNLFTDIVSLWYSIYAELGELYYSIGSIGQENAIITILFSLCEALKKNTKLSADIGNKMNILKYQKLLNSPEYILLLKLFYIVFDCEKFAIMSEKLSLSKSSMLQTILIVLSAEALSRKPKLETQTIHTPSKIYGLNDTDDFQKMEIEKDSIKSSKDFLFVNTLPKVEKKGIFRRFLQKLSRTNKKSRKQIENDNYLEKNQFTQFYENLNRFKGPESSTNKKSQIDRNAYEVNQSESESHDNTLIALIENLKNHKSAENILSTTLHHYLQIFRLLSNKSLSFASRNDSSFQKASTGRKKPVESVSSLQIISRGIELKQYCCENLFQDDHDSKSFAMIPNLSFSVLRKAKKGTDSSCLKANLSVDCLIINISVPYLIHLLDLIESIHHINSRASSSLLSEMYDSDSGTNLHYYEVINGKWFDDNFDGLFSSLNSNILSSTDFHFSLDRTTGRFMSDSLEVYLKPFNTSFCLNIDEYVLDARLIGLTIFHIRSYDTKCSILTKKLLTVDLISDSQKYASIDLIKPIVSNLKLKQSKVNSFLHIDEFSIELRKDISKFIDVFEQIIFKLNLNHKLGQLNLEHAGKIDRNQLLERLSGLTLKRSILVIDRIILRLQLLKSFRVDILMQDISISGYVIREKFNYLLLFPNQSICFTSSIKLADLSSSVAFKLPSFNATYDSLTDVDLPDSEFKRHLKFNITKFTQVISSKMINHILLFNREYLIEFKEMIIKGQRLVDLFSTSFLSRLYQQTSTSSPSKVLLKLSDINIILVSAINDVVFINIIDANVTYKTFPSHHKNNYKKSKIHFNHEIFANCNCRLRLGHFIINSDQKPLNFMCAVDMPLHSVVAYNSYMKNQLDVSFADCSVTINYLSLRYFKSFLDDYKQTLKILKEAKRNYEADFRAFRSQSLEDLKHDQANSQASSGPNSFLLRLNTKSISITLPVFNMNNNLYANSSFGTNLELIANLVLKCSKSTSLLMLNDGIFTTEFFVFLPKLKYIPLVYSSPLNAQVPPAAGVTTIPFSDILLSEKIQLKFKYCLDETAGGKVNPSCSTDDLDLIEFLCENTRFYAKYDIIKSVKEAINGLHIITDSIEYLERALAQKTPVVFHNFMSKYNNESQGLRARKYQEITSSELSSLEFDLKNKFSSKNPEVQSFESSTKFVDELIEIHRLVFDKSDAEFSDAINLNVHYLINSGIITRKESFSTIAPRQNTLYPKKRMNLRLRLRTNTLLYFKNLISEAEFLKKSHKNTIDSLHLPNAMIEIDYHFDLKTLSHQISSILNLEFPITKLSLTPDILDFVHKCLECDSLEVSTKKMDRNNKSKLQIENQKGHKGHKIQIEMNLNILPTNICLKAPKSSKLNCHLSLPDIRAHLDLECDPSLMSHSLFSRCIFIISMNLMSVKIEHTYKAFSKKKKEIFTSTLREIILFSKFDAQNVRQFVNVLNLKYFAAQTEDRFIDEIIEFIMAWKFSASMILQNTSNTSVNLLNSDAKNKGQEQASCASPPHSDHLPLCLLNFVKIDCLSLELLSMKNFGQIIAQFNGIEFSCDINLAYRISFNCFMNLKSFHVVSQKAPIHFDIEAYNLTARLSQQKILDAILRGLVARVNQISAYLMYLDDNVLLTNSKMLNMTILQKDFDLFSDLKFDLNSEIFNAVAFDTSIKSVIAIESRLKKIVLPKMLARIISEFQASDATNNPDSATALASRPYYSFLDGRASISQLLVLNHLDSKISSQLTNLVFVNSNNFTQLDNWILITLHGLSSEITLDSECDTNNLNNRDQKDTKLVRRQSTSVNLAANIRISVSPPTLASTNPSMAIFIFKLSVSNNRKPFDDRGSNVDSSYTDSWLSFLVRSKNSHNLVSQADPGVNSAESFANLPENFAGSSSVVMPQNLIMTIGKVSTKFTSYRHKINQELILAIPRNSHVFKSNIRFYQPIMFPKMDLISGSSNNLKGIMPPHKRPKFLVEIFNNLESFCSENMEISINPELLLYMRTIKNKYLENLPHSWKEMKASNPNLDQNLKTNHPNNASAFLLQYPDDQTSSSQRRGSAFVPNAGSQLLNPGDSQPSININNCKWHFAPKVTLVSPAGQKIESIKISSILETLSLTSINTTVPDFLQRNLVNCGIDVICKLLQKGNEEDRN